MLAIAIFLGGVALGEARPSAKFTLPDEQESVNTEGVVTLQWVPSEKGEDPEFELQQSASGDFSNPKTRYTGPDLGSVLTGFNEGEYHFRVRTMEPAGEWSEPVSVKIEYIGKSTVILLLGIGVTVFLATISTLVACHFRKPEE